MRAAEKKELERQTLAHLLSTLDVVLTSDPEPGETPDFILPTDAGRIGVEITTFQTGMLTDDGVFRRNAEATWDAFEATADAFQAKIPHLNEVYVWLGFKASMPPKRDHLKLIEEISDFALKCLAETGPVDTDHRQMPLPLMRQYLDRVRYTIGRYPVWQSNINGGGWISLPVVR